MTTRGHGNTIVCPLSQHKHREAFAPSKKSPAGGREHPVVFRFNGYDNEGEREYCCLFPVAKHALGGVCAQQETLCRAQEKRPMFYVPCQPAEQLEDKGHLFLPPITHKPRRAFRSARNVPLG